MSYFHRNKTAYSMGLNLTVERQITKNMVASAGCVGSLGRHLMTIVEANPGNHALCLSLSQPQDVAPGTPTCGPFGENLVYTLADGTVVNGTRNLAGFPNTIGTDAWFRNMGNSNYNALDLSVKQQLPFTAEVAGSSAAAWVVQFMGVAKASFSGAPRFSNLPGGSAFVASDSYDLR